jgi:hypothetical protein
MCFAELSSTDPMLGLAGGAYEGFSPSFGFVSDSWRCVGAG